jgi:hypothetical protein
MPGSTARTQCDTPMKSTPKIHSMSESVISANGVKAVTPALAQSKAIGPRSSTAWTI